MIETLFLLGLVVSMAIVFIDAIMEGPPDWWFQRGDSPTTEEENSESEKSNG